METEKLCYKGKPIRPEEQSKAWSIYLAILEALIKLDLEKKNWIDQIARHSWKDHIERSRSTNVVI